MRDRFHDGAARVRVTDVARRAGCAAATVSRVLNTPDMVSPDKRAKIEAAMRELGYVRNHAARALRSQRSNMVGVLIPTLDYALYASLVGAATARLSEAGLTTLIATFGYDLEAEFREARLLVERGAEALILIGDRHHEDLYRLLRQFDTPFVNTYVLDPASPRPSVGFDNAAAGASLARHLIHLGHRNICVISGLTTDNDRTTQRLEGIRAEMQRHGLPLDTDHIIERRYSIGNGREACAALLDRLSPRPTAIICGNDVLALGAMGECRARGLAIPADISLVGFDNLELSEHCSPPLTTLNVPAGEMGTRAAGYLLDRLAGRQPSDHIPVGVELILRDSTAPPPTVS
ncbi:LacI family DNA-binding transcriptional regulator [Palleronia caenipelagi]|uniref:LacI family transcriptional regulator n=1 Tax=Palleronia caenipelagi TaxID=2489174 RepID=A0A547Q6I9_9RHOB|nr:LacI family DNA-binding transcriptional regulator [Palleronia caenipelagi]TRD22006.1 LacI family transcriptional regulator [Palleronia caenipelagi]